MAHDGSMPEVSDLDKQAASTLRRSERMVRVLIGVLLAAVAILSGGLAWSLKEQGTQNSELSFLLGTQKTVTARIDARVFADVRSICKTARDIGTSPASVNPATKRPSVLGLKLIADFRDVYYGHGCLRTFGALPPPDKTFAKWAAVLGVSYRR